MKSDLVLSFFDFSSDKWQFLYFLPLPQGQGSFLPTFFIKTVFVSLNLHKKGYSAKSAMITSEIA